MTTIIEAHTTIKTAIRDTIVWPGLTPPIVYENTGVRTESEYITVAIKHFTSRQRSMGVVGNRSWTRIGNIQFVLYTPAGAGTTRELEWAYAIDTGLEGKNMDGVLFYDCTPAETGTVGAWRFLVIHVGFNYHSHK